MFDLFRCSALLCFLGAFAPTAGAQGSLNILAWNIWHGGKEDGEAGLARTIEVIRDSGADLVAMQETYGSGEVIAEALGFDFHPRGTNVSIHSRYPVVEDISVHTEFHCVGALVELPNATQLAFYSIWLPYAKEIWKEGTRDVSDEEGMLAACEPSAVELTAIWKKIEERLAGEKYAGVPIVIAGDFNSMSHLDYGEVGWDQYGAVVDWPTSHVLMDAGFLDCYRACHGRIERSVDATWTPRFPGQEQDRIDYIYLRGAGWGAAESRVIRDHAGGFPSDHAALLATLKPVQTPGEEAIALRVASYNIRHGEGMDGKVDLGRTAGVLRRLSPDIVGLQEVDLGTQRTGQHNQVQVLAKELGMHPAFGSFMDYQGGKYGMGILSAHPIVDVDAVRLPEGNEPRIALVARVQLPTGERVALVNVHFDWVADDGYRFAQAQALGKYLGQLREPYLLVGDFNDEPDSRTLGLFRDLAVEIPKPPEDRFTMSSVEPLKEIDFLFHSAGDRWRADKTVVIVEPLASDHRPLLADVFLLR